VLSLALLVLPAWAERLPIRVYGASEGLSGDHVRAILQDSQGFLWIATNAGVSRFDGYDFQSYGVGDGLPYPSASALAEDGEGMLLVVSRQRVVRRPIGRSAGEPFRPIDTRAVGEVFDVATAPDGVAVVAGTRGTFRVEGERLSPVDLGEIPLSHLPSAETVWAVAYDRDGTLWAARTFGIARIARDEPARVLALPAEQPLSPGWGWVSSLVPDPAGGVWVVTPGGGIWRVATGPAGEPEIVETLDWPTTSELPRTLHAAPDGTLWLGTTRARGALMRVEGSAGGRRLVPIGPDQGIPDEEVYALTTDAQGNLWGGTGAAGLFRVAADGLTAWGEADGLSPGTVAAIENDPHGGVQVILADFHVAAVRDGRVVTHARRAVGIQPGWGSQQLVARDLDGRLWAATAVGLATYPRDTTTADLPLRRPERVVTRADGLSGTEIHRVFAASDGAIWVGVIHVPDGVCRIPRGGGAIRCFGEEHGLAPQSEGAAFAEDGAGGIWVGLYDGGLYRFRSGRFETWPEVASQAQATTFAIRRDGEGRLWVAGDPGLLRIDSPEEERPVFRRYGSADGLSSWTTFATADDRFGRVYVGGVHGVDRIDLATGTVRRFTTADGLPANHVRTMHRDPDGDLWIGTSRGLARLVPRAGGHDQPPRAFMTSVRVAGTIRDPADPLTLASDERTVEFAFTAPSFRAAETMRFQWRLLGAFDEWSRPGPQRNITFAGLGPGSYRLEVRAVDGDGLVSAPVPAEFRIRPPFWRTIWFAGVVVAVSALAAVGIHRFRVTRLVEVERVRTRIATDLHDDIGSSLSQIAVLSQVANRQVAQDATTARKSLDRITDLSGDVVDAMSDVVWAIDPARDRISDLVHRMRRFAVDLFSESEVELRLDLPDDRADSGLDPDARRQIYLVFKEALRNAARHANASTIEVVLRRRGPGLSLSVRDNGRGVGGGASERGGQGLRSMRARAEAIGARLTVRPRQEGGTEVVLETGAVRARSLSKRTGAATRKAP